MEKTRDPQNRMGGTAGHTRERETNSKGGKA